MAREQLQALVDDVDRLLGAGSAAAAGDDRLRQRARTLRELARQVPALAGVADAVERACQSDTAQANRALLDLVITARQLRVGLKPDGLSGDVTPLPASGPWATDLPADEVYRLSGALNGGGYSYHGDGLESPGAVDLRLAPLLVSSLDEWGPAGDQAAVRVLPRLGRQVLPDLEFGLDLGQRPGAGRRLAAMALIDVRTAFRVCTERMPGEPGAVGLLGRLGRPAVELFVAILANPNGNYANWDLGRMATDVLARFGDAAIDLVRPTLGDPDPARREASLRVIGDLGRSANSAVPGLTAALGDDVASVRAAAAQALAKIGAKPAAAAYPELIAALQDPVDEVRQAAAEAVKNAGMPGADVVPMLIGVLGHASPAVRVAAVGALSKAAKTSKPAMAALRSAEKSDPDAGVRSAVAWTLKLLRGKK